MWINNWYYNFLHSLTFFSISYDLALRPTNIIWKKTQPAQVHIPTAHSGKDMKKRYLWFRQSICMKSEYKPGQEVQYSSIVCEMQP